MPRGAARALKALVAGMLRPRSSVGDTVTLLNAGIKKNEPFIKIATRVAAGTLCVAGLLTHHFERLKEAEKNAAVAQAQQETDRLLALAFHGDYDDDRKERAKRRAAGATAAANTALVAATERGASVGAGSAIA